MRDFVPGRLARPVSGSRPVRSEFSGPAPLSRLAVLGVVAVLLAFPFPSPAQETLSSVQRELERVEREIEREKDLHKAERTRAAEFEKQKEVRLQALAEQLDATDARIDSLKARTETERRRRGAQRGIAAQYQQRQTAFRSDLDREIQAAITWMETDFPYQRERRLSEWRDLAEANREATLPVEEVLARLFGLVQGSLDFAQNTEAYPGTYASAKGERYEGFYVRLGAVAMVFSSSDGKLQAYLAKTVAKTIAKTADASNKADTANTAGAHYTWRDENLTSETRDAIREAVSVAQGREAPRLVPLPVEVAGNGGVQ